MTRSTVKPFPRPHNFAPDGTPIEPSAADAAAELAALDLSQPLAAMSGETSEHRKRAVDLFTFLRELVSLRTTVGIVLGSRNPMFLFWGPELIQIYNDAYRPSLGTAGMAGSRHPRPCPQDHNMPSATGSPPFERRGRRGVLSDCVRWTRVPSGDAAPRPAWRNRRAPKH